MSHTWSQTQEWNDKSYAKSEEFVSEVDFKHMKQKWNFQFANNLWTLGVRGALLKEDWKVSAGAAYESHPENNEWKMSVDSSIKSPDMSGVKARINVSPALA